MIQFDEYFSDGLKSPTTVVIHEWINPWDYKGTERSCNKQPHLFTAFLGPPCGDVTQIPMELQVDYFVNKFHGI